MAAIDKLYLNSYDELYEFRLWCLIHYPKIFSYWYPPILLIGEKEFNKIKLDSAKTTYKKFKEDWKNTSPDGTINGGIAYLIAKYGMSEEDAKWNVEYSRRNSQKTIDELLLEFKLPVMNTPIKVDKFLLWRCPLDYIRVYLEEQCGYKTHWYHKLFFKKL